MSVIKNKVQLIDLIVSSLTDSPILSKSCLVVTGSKETQYKIRDGVVTPFPSLNITHEEADIIIINQLLWVVKDKPQARVLVICDDTDVFVLLLHFYFFLSRKSAVVMEGTSASQASVVNGATVAHKDIVFSILAAQCIDGL